MQSAEVADKVTTKKIVLCNIKHCLNCGNCVTACARRHKDVSRHMRAGSPLLGISLIPNLCKVCRDPKCIAACRFNAIEQDESGNIVVNDSCIGCGICARACPYNAILIFSTQGKKGSLLNTLLSLVNSNGKKEKTDEKG